MLKSGKKKKLKTNPDKIQKILMDLKYEKKIIDYKNYWLYILLKHLRNLKIICDETEENLQNFEQKDLYCA